MRDNNIEILAHDLWVKFGTQFTNYEDFIKESEWLFSQGWIHKSDAVEYVAICKACQGSGDIGVDYINKGPKKCELCNGNGLLPLKEPNGKDER